MQMLGGGLILIGCLGLGLWYRQQMVLRLHFTRELICILEQWISEIRYNRSSLPECCRQIGRQRKDCLGEICDSVYREYAASEATSFLEFAQESFRRRLKPLPLKKRISSSFCFLWETRVMRMKPCRSGQWNCPNRGWNRPQRRNSGS